MEQTGFDLPEKPRGFEDYLTAARKVIEYAVYCPQPEVGYVSRSVDETYPDAIDTLDEVVAEYQQQSPVPAQLVYGFAYRLFMEDSVSNTRNGYSEIRGLSASIEQSDAVRAALTTETVLQLVQIEKTMSEISEVLTTDYVAKTLDRADRLIDNDNRLKRKYRKILVSLGLKDDEKGVIGQEWQGLSEVELRWRLRDLAIARARILAEEYSATR